MAHEFFDLGSTYLVFGGCSEDGDKTNPWKSFHRRTYTQEKAEILVADKLRAGDWDWYQIVWGRNFNKPIRDSRTWRPYKRTKAEHLLYIDGDEGYQFDQYRSLINSWKKAYGVGLTVVSPSFAGFNQSVSVYCMDKQVDCVELNYDGDARESFDTQILNKLNKLKVNEAVYYGDNLVYSLNSIERLQALKRREITVRWYTNGLPGLSGWKYFHTLGDIPAYIPPKTVEMGEDDERL